MKILAVDTALGACSVALLEGESVAAHRCVAMERGHAEALAPMVEEAMAGHDFASLERLGVTTGPGTFTGQRVGLAFMRGLKVALGIPLAGVTTLAAMAAQAKAECGTARAIALHDARRDEGLCRDRRRPRGDALRRRGGATRCTRRRHAHRAGGNGSQSRMRITCKGFRAFERPPARRVVGCAACHQVSGR